MVGARKKREPLLTANTSDANSEILLLVPLFPPAPRLWPRVFCGEHFTVHTEVTNDTHLYAGFVAALTQRRIAI